MIILVIIAQEGVFSMEDTSEKKSGKKPSKHICLGLLAHVDAGKTTLAEGILYLTGSIRKLGRVDHQDAFLDNYALERERGITIFSKQAELALENLPVTLMDTPGHVDFSAEMERTLQILDYAVLVISGADGVQGHLETLWRLLARYQVPVFLFVNKMDQQGTDRTALMEELTRRLDGRCVDFGPLYGQDSAKNPQQVSEEFWESLAMCDETLLERGAVGGGDCGGRGRAQGFSVLFRFRIEAVGCAGAAGRRPDIQSGA